MNKRLLSGLAALVMVFSGTAALPAGTFEGIDISASAAGNVDPNTYYLVGTMSGWGPKSDYAFVPVRLGLYVVKNVELSADDEFKGALTDSYCEFTDDNWYPGGMDNNVKAPEAGVYTIYFRPAGDGDEKDGFDVLSENDSRRMFKFVKEDTGTIGGTCGENLTWALDDDGTLTISGTGKMYNFGESIDATGPQPWLDHKDEIKKVVVADGVTSIGSDAFYYLPNLESAELPDSVTSIGSFAFSYSEKLKSVDLPSKLKKIDYYVFSNCTSLESITIPDRVTTIEPGAFRSCTSLKNVTVPNSVTAIGEKAFGYYDDMFEGTDLKLKDFTISGGKGTAAETYAADNEITFIPVDEPENVASGKCGEDVSWALAEDGTLTIKGSGYMTDYEVADAAGVPWSKYVKKIKKVVIFDGVTSIGAAAFYKCQKLESVDIPDTVMDIGDFAFALCSSLKK